jgi:acyl-CoA synthetase (AMP-forming)/AMP-acid ligase II
MDERMKIPQYTLEDYEQRFAERHRLQDVLAKWAAVKPGAAALVSAESGRAVSWSEFDRVTRALAGELLRLGFARGDFLVTVLPWSIELVLLQYGCFRIGVIVAPLDVRLSAADVNRAFELLKPRGVVWPGVETKGGLDLNVLAEAAWRAAKDGAASPEAQAAAEDAVTENDGALVIFTTGSTGSPKPALLSHRSITAQNMCLSGAFMGGDKGIRALVHLPPSHVGGQSELLMSILFGGGTAVLMETFDAARTLRTIAEHRVQILGQIPAMFQLEWMVKDYDRMDLSSLEYVVYGGNAVPKPFLERMATMAPVIGTGLGLTEASGFCTYALAGAGDWESLAGGLGVAMPVYSCTIRQPMGEDGRAGEALAQGTVGHVCFRGPQTFLGYVGDAAATAKTISSDGFLYTGDLGFMDGSGLHLTGREKWVIKSFSYQIFPGDVEEHICALAEQVASCVVVGVDHKVASEAVVALVEKRPGAALKARELDRHARALAAYMRPRHWMVLEPGQMPLNRIGKPDYVRAQAMAKDEIAKLRGEGGWDSGFAEAADRERP